MLFYFIKLVFTDHTTAIDIVVQTADLKIEKSFSSMLPYGVLILFDIPTVKIWLRFKQPMSKRRIYKFSIKIYFSL